MTDSAAPRSPFRAAGAALARRRALPWPAFLLAMAMAAMLLLNFDREHYYAPVEWDTAKNLALAENLSPQRNFLLFLRLSPDENGEPSYATYSRFPIGSYALIKLVAMPFGDDLAAKIFAARMLMLAFFTGAAFLAYHSIARIASNRWIALIATLTPFSSYYLLRYSNWVSNEFSLDLFAVMLTFHGMVIFAQEGRFRQLLIKTCVSLILGWHVYAFIGPFAALGLGSELVKVVKARRNADPSRQSASERPTLLGTLRRSPYLRLGAVALLFGSAILTFNVVNEYNALNGEKSLSELPTARSLTYRSGLRPGPNDGFAWDNFLRGQFSRVAGASFPQALINWPGVTIEEPPNLPPLHLTALGILATGAALAGLLFVRRDRMLLATLALSGFCWALVLRGNTQYWKHQHEAIFYVGVPLTLTALLLLGACRFGAARFLPAAGIAALLIFALSASQMIAKGPEAVHAATRQQAILADMTVIREMIRGKTVVVAHSEDNRSALYGDSNILDFYLSGSQIHYANGRPPSEYDFVLIPHRDESAPLLTPRNHVVFLYGRADPAALQQSRIKSLASGVPNEPTVRSVFDVSATNDALVYFKEPCADADLRQKFFLHIFPERTSDLPEPQRAQGQENLDFNFQSRGAAFDGECAARVPLPNYAIASIRTGQFHGGDELWEAAFVLNPDSYRAAYESAVSREPDARAAFNLYLDEEARTLVYVKEPCADSDVEQPFFLHITPERADDLPPDRRELGFDSGGFEFRLRGVAFDGKCVARAALPKYSISNVRTGQWIRGEGELWESTVQFGDDRE